RPRLLDHLETHTDTRIEQADRRWNDLSHHPRALAAAKNEQAKLTLSRRSIGNASRREHLRAQGIARECYFRVPVAIEILDRAESGRNGCNTRRQKSVGAPHYAILFVQDRRHVAPTRRQKRRHGRITAKTNHHLRLDAAEQCPGFGSTERE